VKEVTAFLEVFLQCWPISIPDAVMSIYSCAQNHRGEGGGGPSLIAPSGSLAAPALRDQHRQELIQHRMPSGSGRHLKPVKTLHKKDN